jgi:hypothetical protein
MAASVVWGRVGCQVVEIKMWTARVYVDSGTGGEMIWYGEFDEQGKWDRRC